VVAAGAIVDSRCTTDFAHPDDERFFQQASLLQIDQ
tara:strand:+ start:503 stop:610 length:108 start_codon:yes stop_codon:yes gene_type:complete